MSEKNNKKLNEMMIEFENLTREFDNPEFDVETATDKFREASELAKKIREKLNEHENEIEIIRKDFAKIINEN